MRYKEKLKELHLCRLKKGRVEGKFYCTQLGSREIQKKIEPVCLNYNGVKREETMNTETRKFRFCINKTFSCRTSDAGSEALSLHSWRYSKHDCMWPLGKNCS